MLENIGAQIVSGVLAFSMMLFSNFKGNSPEFGWLNLSLSQSYLYVNAELNSAFENDFPVLFASGKDIPIHFRVNIKSKGKQVYVRKHSYTVSFDTISGVYTLVRSTGDTPYHTKSVEELIRELGRIRISVPYQKSWGEISLSLEASLPKIRLDEDDRETDLMAFWRFKKPKIKTQLKIDKLNRYQRSTKLWRYEESPAEITAA